MGIGTRSERRQTLECVLTCTSVPSLSVHMHVHGWAQGQQRCKHVPRMVVCAGMCNGAAQEYGRRAPGTRGGRGCELCTGENLNVSVSLLVA